LIERRWYLRLVVFAASGPVIFGHGRLLETEHEVIVMPNRRDLSITIETYLRRGTEIA